MNTTYPRRLAAILPLLALLTAAACQASHDAEPITAGPAAQGDVVELSRARDTVFAPPAELRSGRDPQVRTISVDGREVELRRVQ